MIKIQNLKKAYKDCVALDTVSMHIRKGEFVAIIGASGSGKTTMLNIIGGLDTDYMGSCVVRNKEMSSLSDVECCTLRSRYISYVYQFFNLISFLTVKENVCLASQIKGKKVDAKELNRVLKLLGLEHKKDCFANELSGGQQQRVAIARSLVTKSKIIIADEPTGNLDEDTTKEIVTIFKQIAHEENKIVIIVTHEKEVANASDVIYELKHRQFNKIK